MKNYLMIVSVCMCLAACASGSKSDSAAADETPAFQKSVDYIPSALGPHSWKITTDSVQAQQYFDQGLQLRYAFGVDDAARSFREARLADPQCAMCYWGEAFALGSFLNGGMTAEKAPYAYEAIKEAAALAGNATEVERDLIMAAYIRYPENYDPDNRRSDDEAFSREMALVYEKYPDHHDVAVVYAVSLFLLEERRGYRDLADPDLIRLHGVLTNVLAEDITHPGACHLYIHATESSQDPGLALPCAEYLGAAIPVSSHIQHMPSHTWNEVGYWGKSVRANTAARHSDLMAAENQGFSYAPSHNLHMLLFAASYDGQGAVATQAGKDYRKVADSEIYEALTLIRFGRFDEVVGMTDRPKDEVHAAMWDFAVGYANLREGNTDLAIETAQNLIALAETTEAKFRFHPGGQIIGTLGNILAGEIERANGDLDAAIVSFRKATAFEDQMAYDEPEPMPFAARHWLGAALIEAGQYAEAEREYRVELKDHPHDVWSLYGLKSALKKQGESDAAVEKDFAASTARMDVWITASRF
jgi:hypothetical protein